MRKLVSLAICGLVALALPAVATDLTIGLRGFTVSMGHINGLIEEFEQDAELDLSPLLAGAGIEADVGIFAMGDRGSIGFGGRGLLVRETFRDVTITASLVGLFARAEFAFGKWMAHVDAGGHRGTYSFPAARIPGLSGWGAGLGGGVAYRLPLTERFALALDLGLAWLPVPEMSDADGQKYRGRGTPFMDFSGISASIKLTWLVPERSNE